MEQGPEEGEEMERSVSKEESFFPLSQIGSGWGEMMMAFGM